MEAPDKLYVVPMKTKSQDAFVGLAYELDKLLVRKTEYIHKEALLEWAKEVHDSGPIKDSADKGDAWSIGYLCSTADLIDKLNTL